MTISKTFFFLHWASMLPWKRDIRSDNAPFMNNELWLDPEERFWIWNKNYASWGSSGQCARSLLIFIIYKHKCINHSSTFHFADDTNLLNISENYKILQKMFIVISNPYMTGCCPIKYLWIKIRLNLSTFINPDQTFQLISKLKWMAKD